jgi:uncharacterized membrane protein YbaN (DUF454 family)
MKRILKIATGWMFVVLGVLGLFLPILQGILFLAIGFSILATEYPWAKRWLDWLRAKFPRYASAFDQAKERSSVWIKKFNGAVKGAVTGPKRP